MRPAPRMATMAKMTLIAMTVIVCGCTNSLKVKGEFPAPLITSLPQTLGVIYDQEFRNYVYSEENEDRSKWIIDSGPAQVALFNQVLPELFSQVQELQSLPTPASPATTDLVLYPKLQEFQYSVPRETRFKIFEVWMKYNLSVYDHQGVLIADYIVTAYGKTPTAFMQSNEEAMNAAVVIALRDLGANISLSTKRVPEIKSWLEQHPPTGLQAAPETASPARQQQHKENDQSSSLPSPPNRQVAILED